MIHSGVTAACKHAIGLELGFCVLCRLEIFPQVRHPEVEGVVLLLMEIAEEEESCFTLQLKDEKRRVILLLM